MTDLQKAYNGLSEADRQRLMLGFNSATDQIVKLDGGYFLGVYVHNRHGLIVLEEQNHFIYGKYKENELQRTNG